MWDIRHVRSYHAHRGFTSLSFLPQPFTIDSMADLDVPYLSSNPPNPKPVFRHGDWLCSRHHCGAHNFGRNLSCIGCGCPRNPTMNDPRAHVFYSSAQPQWSGPQQPQQQPSQQQQQQQQSQRPVDLAQLTSQLAGLALPKPHHHQPPPPPKPAQPLLTPSGRAFAIGGRVQNVSTDPLAPCIMYWPDNEPFPEPGQIRPSNVVGVAPPILNTGNRGPISHQPGDWICQKCNYLNWRRRKVCQTCLPYAEGNGDSISAAVQAERIALLTQVLSQTAAAASSTTTFPASLSSTSSSTFGHHVLPASASSSMITSMTSISTATPGPRSQTLTPPQIRSRIPSVVGVGGGYLGDHSQPHHHIQGRNTGGTIYRSRSQLSLSSTPAAAPATTSGLGYCSPSPMIYQTGMGPQSRASRSTATGVAAQDHTQYQQHYQREDPLTLQQQEVLAQRQMQSQQHLLHQSFPAPPPPPSSHQQSQLQQLQDMLPQQQHRVQQQQQQQQSLHPQGASGSGSGAGGRAPPSPLYATGPVPGAFSFVSGSASASARRAGSTRSSTSASASPAPPGSARSSTSLTPAPGSAGVSAGSASHLFPQYHQQATSHGHQQLQGDEDDDDDVENGVMMGGNGGRTISVHAPAPLLPSFLQDMVQDSPPSLSPASNASSSSVSELQEDLMRGLDADGEGDDYAAAFDRVRRMMLLRPRVSSGGSTDSAGSGRSGSGSDIQNIWKMVGEEVVKTPGTVTPFAGAGPGIPAGALGGGHGNGGVGVIGMGRLR